MAKRDDNVAISATGRPLQRLSWSEKIANKRQWFKDNIDWGIKSSSFYGAYSYTGTNAGSGSGHRRNMHRLYEVYNNKIPLEWFSHITNPLSASKKEHKQFPAKIRPVNILRTNLDLLMGEQPKRPFSYFVSNLGDEGYNRFLDGMNEAVNGNLQQIFMARAAQIAEQEGIDLSTDDGQQQLAQIAESIPPPQEVASAYKLNYKDKLAMQGQNWLKIALAENDIRRTQHRMFKDWLIAGECYSYKGVWRSKLEYKRISPLQIDYDKSPDVQFIEDGDWVTAWFPMTLSDIVDMFYDEFKEEDLNTMESTAFSGAGAFYSHLYGLYTDSRYELDKIPVYHTTWKGKKKIKEITYLDPLTGEELIEVVDEDVPSDLEGLEILNTKPMWVNCWYEGWAIGNVGSQRIYVGMKEIPNQRTEMNNFSKCKGPYNGRKYSDEHSENISVLEMGLPFLIMHMIYSYTLELTIAKSKGKILLIDKGAIPRSNGWDEEKFFYYSEALGYGLLDRAQIGADKSFNQYQALDMSLFDNIQQLIELQRHNKQEWDDLIGITRQRKGQTYASDRVGANEAALFQSTVITDMIFTGFEHFVEKELQGILDLSKFTNVDGVRKLFNESEVDYALLEIDGSDYSLAELGVFCTNASEEKDKLDAMSGYAATFAQNPDIRPSTIVEIITSDNIAKMKANLRKIEDIQMQVAQSTAENEQAAQQEIERIRQETLKLEHTLDKDLMNAEYDRKEAIEYIKGEFNSLRNLDGNDGDNNDNGIPDVFEVMQNQTKIQEIQQKGNIEMTKVASQERMQDKELADKDKERKTKMEIEKLKARTALKNKVSGEKK